MRIKVPRTVHTWADLVEHWSGRPGSKGEPS
jgi:hypothetical protein